MNTTLTTKEKFLLEDQKSHEETCIQKYSNYANLASDQQLKNMFNNHAKIEQEHLNTINQMLNGQVPAMNNQQSGGSVNPQQNQQQQQPQQNLSNMQAQGSNNSFQTSDKEICNDMLMTEKYVSNAYDTAIFEFKDPQIRSTLNHIQKEEQQHGEAIFKYMESKGMYTLK
ncbi:MAG: coat protein [Clostridiales bacterium]|jgi:spore coat protein CotF|nr:coat protein [Clostridiales bacterium]